MLGRHHLAIAALIIISMIAETAQRSTCRGEETGPMNVNPPAPLSVAPVEQVFSPVEPLFVVGTSSPSGFTLRVRGRIDTDAIWSHQSPANEATYGDLSDVVGLRRARIGVEGELGTDRRYLAEIDLASGFVVPRDVYLGLGNRQHSVEAQVGHFREPFSLEGGTSARYFAFMERSPINVLDPARNWGLGFYHEDVETSSSLAFGAFHAGTDAGDFQGGDGSTVGFTGRLTTAPINRNDGRQLLHLGLSLSERVPENGVIVINQQPRSPLLDLGDSSTTPFVPSLKIPAVFQQLVNLQVAGASGSFWTQAEWYGSWIDQPDAGSIFFHGCHADCGYFITGEHRKYDASNGTLGTIHVQRPFLRSGSNATGRRGWGAWELTARFAYLDFVDPDTPMGPNAGQPGIQLSQTTLGTNWYLSDWVRVMFNYTYAIPDQAGVNSGAASVFGTRLAVFW